MLRLPDLEHAKTAVLNNLISADAQRGYRHAIDEFVFCATALISNLVNAHINLQSGAVRRRAYEAAEGGQLRADLAAGIRRVKGVKQLGARLRNWLAAEPRQALSDLVPSRLSRRTRTRLSLGNVGTALGTRDECSKLYSV